jgi:hypothetical protein
MTEPAPSKPISGPSSGPPTGHLPVEVFYERSFLMDLRMLKVDVADRIRAFVFSDYFQTTPMQFLPEFRALESSKIFYRFTLENHLLSMEVTGHIIKFIRVLPKPPV